MTTEHQPGLAFAYHPSSRRKPGPISRTQVMGPGFRRDDGEGCGRATRLPFVLLVRWNCRQRSQR